jgi:cytidine deaminase
MLTRTDSQTALKEDLEGSAFRAAMLAYAPYSRFKVGAAVLADGNVYTGCNIENASYGLAICAERVAVFNAISAGARRLEAVAVACVDAHAQSHAGMLMPCGACRQVLAEFGDPNLPIYVLGVGTMKLDKLLPNPFILKRRE